MYFIGIDPGFTGAIAVVNSAGELVSCCDTPTFVVAGGRKNKTHFDVQGMVQLLTSTSFMLLPSYPKAALENVNAMPEQGIVGAFAFGRGLGIWEGILAALKVPITLVRPQAWKKTMMPGEGKEKDASRRRALQLFPKAELNLKKHHGRADAILIAEWLRRQEVVYS